MSRVSVYTYPFMGSGRKLSLIFLISLLITIGFCSFAGIGTSTQPEEKGEAIFEEKCLPCHTVGHGDGVGPDLKGVTKNRDREWLVRFIKSPGMMLDEGDPTATGLLEKFKGKRMPDSGLTEAEIALLLSYLDKKNIVQPETAAEPSPAELEPHPEGDAMTGLNLFAGSAPFEKGGAPCIACHSIAGIAALGGGTLGPDLSTTFDDYGEEELTSVLSSIPFPTMKPIYHDHPLSAGEQAHLLAFMKEAADERLSSSMGQLSMLVTGIFLAIIALTWLLWRNRLRDVRKNLVKESRKGGLT